MLQNALKLKAGDILIFGKTKQGELLLGGRARTASDKDRKAPPRTRKSDGAPGEKPVVKSAPPSLGSLFLCHYQHTCQALRKFVGGWIFISCKRPQCMDDMQPYRPDAFRQQKIHSGIWEGHGKLPARYEHSGSCVEAEC